MGEGTTATGDAFSRLVALELGDKLRHLPPDAPAELRALAQIGVHRALAEVGRFEPMPEAELGPEITAARETLSRVLVDLFNRVSSAGRSLWKLRRSCPDAETFWQIVAERQLGTRERCLLCMRITATECAR
jgi:hypothetical protein